MSAVDRLVALAGYADVDAHTRVVDGQVITVGPYRRALRSMSLNDLFHARNEASKSGSRIDLMLILNEIRKRQRALDVLTGIIRPGDELPDFTDPEIAGPGLRRPHVHEGVTSYAREVPSDLLRNRGPLLASLSRILESL